MTLRKATVADREHRLREARLCQSCMNELQIFGRQLTFAEWRGIYVHRVLKGFWQTFVQLVRLCNPFAHWRIVAMQHRLRTRVW